MKSSFITGGGPQLNWHDIRILENSQDRAFEQLCCQLAEVECGRPGSTFFRREAPDAGLECYWHDNEQTMRGWQAKYFTGPPTSKQWEDVDESVVSAMSGQPELVEMTICFAANRQEPRKGNQRWFMDVWRERIVKWGEYAASIGHRPVKFVCWDAHALETMLLGKSQHRGRVWFFFHTESLTPEWFRSRFGDAQSFVHQKYNPAIDVKTETYRRLEFSLRGDMLLDHLKLPIARISAVNAEIRRTIESGLLTEKLTLIDEAVEALRKWLVDTVGQASRIVQMDAALAQLRIVESESAEAARILRRQSPSGQTSTQDGDAYSLERSRLQHLADAASLVSRQFRDIAMFLGRDTRILVEGPAGGGKTHLLLSLADNHIGSGGPAVVVHGAKFDLSPPAQQILGLLDLSCSTFEEFVTALECAAMIARRPALLVIDALNERNGLRIWEAHFDEIISALKDRPWIVLIASLRDTYRRELITPSVERHLVSVRHEGFGPDVLAAVARNFQAYDIELPSSASLMSEFSNPLLLHTVCETAKNRNQRRLPLGHRGLARILDDYVESLDDLLAKSQRLDYSRRENRVARSIAALADDFVSRGRRIVTPDEALAVFEPIHPSSSSYERSMLPQLEHEGVLTVDLFHAWDGPPREAVVFTFERLADHAVARSIIGSARNPSDAEARIREAFRSHGQLSQGLLEALALALPEYCQVELVDVSSTAMKPHAMDAFSATLSSRSSETVQVRALELISELPTIVSYHANLGLALVPNHPLNADDLHNKLKPLSMTVRDSDWTVFINRLSADHSGPAFLIVQWAASHPLENLEEEVIRLCALVLTWLLSTSVAFLRDGATRALVALLIRAPSLVPVVLAAFRDVDDPYIHERLLCATYGVVLRIADGESIGAIANSVWDAHWKTADLIPCHILSRDYARGIIERAIDRGWAPPRDVARIWPPYGSSPLKPVSRAILDAQYRGEWNSGRRAIYRSIFGDEDFARYRLYGEIGKLPFVDARVSSRGARLGDEEDASTGARQRNALRPDLLQRFVAHRVLELGWIEKFFEVHDVDIAGSEFGAGRPVVERIGMKYQSIALNEGLARLSDTYALDGPISYCGPWQLGLRDLDPTLSFSVLGLNETSTSPWLDAWHEAAPVEAFRCAVGRENEVADLYGRLLTVRVDNAEWTPLHGFVSWIEEPALGHDEAEGGLREHWLRFEAFLVRASHARAWSNWAVGQEFFGRSMPQSHALDSVFLREFYRTPAYSSSDNAYNGQPSWTRPLNRGLSIPILVATTGYSSPPREASVRALENRMPGRELGRFLELEWIDDERMCNKAGEFVCFAPFWHSDFRSRAANYVAIRRDELVRFLAANHLSIVWTLLSEKRTVSAESRLVDGAHWESISGSARLLPGGKVVVQCWVPGPCK